MANKESEAELFNCFKNQAKLEMKRSLCNQLYPYSNPDDNVENYKVAWDGIFAKGFFGGEKLNQIRSKKLNTGKYDAKDFRNS